MKNLFLHNLGWKLLSLAIAVSLWFIMFGGPRYNATVSAPIQFQQMPAALEIGADRPQFVTVEVRGPARPLEQAALSKIVVALDLSSVDKPGDRAFPVTEDNVDNLPAGVEFVRATPARIQLRFQPVGGPSRTP
jgi:hypothetical protein